MADDEALVYRFCTSLYAQGTVSDELFKEFEAAFGKAAAIDLVVTCGYYATLGMVLNVSQAEPPDFLKGFVSAFPVPND